MKTNFRFIAICAIISLSLFTGKANAKTKIPIIDTICCNPDSLKIVSTNYPVFCVSWRVSADSACKRPYGFVIQWRPFPGSGTWTEKTIFYFRGTIVTFCDSVPGCISYQWRIRTICVTGTDTTYSDWIGGPKFAMICGADPISFDPGNNNSQSPTKKSKSAINPSQANKPKEN